jgi:glycosyltransferase involved in cell wall biosynthesis
MNSASEHGPKISIVIPLKRANDYLRESLQHLETQSYRNFDVFVVTDEAETVPTGSLDVRFLASGPVPPNIKRMQAARESDAEIIALIDDDAYPVPGWLAAAAQHFADPQVVGVGGPGVTPPSDSALQQASGAVYSSPLVSAGFVYRYLPRAARLVDDQPSCNLLVRRAAFLEHIGSCLKYWPGEDTKLCLLLTSGGRKIVYDPAVLVYHHRRSLFWGHFKQVWNYAVHRGFFAKRYPETSLRPQYFVPTAFVAGNVAAALAAAARVRSVPLRLLMMVYVLAVVIASLLARREHRANPGWTALGIYLTHLTYGVGFAVGLCRKELQH